MTHQSHVYQIGEFGVEVGHVSTILPVADTTHRPALTHNWRVFVRAVDLAGNLSCLIDRCVFHLHPDFVNCKRVLTSTPFAVAENGYASFQMPIEIFFKTSGKCTKCSLVYDVDLHQNIAGRPYQAKESNLKKYRFTFPNPDADFRAKILAAGGAGCFFASSSSVVDV